MHSAFIFESLTVHITDDNFSSFSPDIGGMGIAMRFFPFPFPVSKTPPKPMCDTYTQSQFPISIAVSEYLRSLGLCQVNNVFCSSWCSCIIFSSIVFPWYHILSIVVVSSIGRVVVVVRSSYRAGCPVRGSLVKNGNKRYEDQCPESLSLSIERTQ